MGERKMISTVSRQDPGMMRLQKVKIAGAEDSLRPLRDVGPPSRKP